MNLDDEILQILQQQSSSREEVRLLNDYKGIPIAYDAQVKSVNKPEAVLKVVPFQIVCLELEKSTFVVSHRLPSVVRARVEHLDFASGLATLSHFAYTVDTIGKRMRVRVQPEELIQVLIASKSRKFRGTLLDISETGMGVFTLGAYIHKPGFLRRDSSVRLIFKLLPGDQDVVLNGTIINIIKEQEAYRMGICITPDETSRGQISRFISRRQEEILGDLQKLYDTYRSQQPSLQQGG